MADTDLLDLDAIKARADAATPGPWSNEPDTGAGRVWVQLSPTRYGGRGDLEPVFVGDQGRKRRGFWVRSKPQGESMWGPTREEQYAQMASDAAFIAAARTDIPALLDLVARLRDQLAEARKQREYWHNQFLGSSQQGVLTDERADRLEGVVARISALHKRGGSRNGFCTHCIDADLGLQARWPCTTMRAVLAVPANTPAPDLEVTADAPTLKQHRENPCTCPASSMFNGPSAHCPIHGSSAVVPGDGEQT